MQNNLKGPIMACAVVQFLLKTQSFRFLWTPLTASFRFSKKGYKVLAPQNFLNYESLKQQYKPEVPEYFNFATDVLDKWTEMEKEGKRPTRLALWWVNDKGDEVRWNFEELGFHSKKVANVLSEVCCLQKGDRVMLILPRIPEWWLINVACMRTGTVLIPGTTQLTAKDILLRVQTSKAKCIITDHVLAPAIDRIVSECQSLKFKLIVSEDHLEGWLNFKDLFTNANADHNCVTTRNQDPMTIFFTSGTTGSPKMTEHSHSSYGIGLTVNGRYWLDLTSSDILWNTSDTGWAKSAWSSIFAPWIQGACVFVHSMPRFDPTTVLDVLVCGTFKGMKIKPGSMGMPSPAYDVKIIDEHGNVLPPGEEGDIAIQARPTRPFCLFTRYIDDPERTDSTLQGNFYITADRGIVDEDGYFWFVGRADDVINSAGYRIGPFEVESALIEHPAVVESAVVSSPDPIRGEVVKAFVVLASDYVSHDPEKLTKELQDHVKKVTAPYKYPRKVEFVQQLPKTVSGKIRRNELRKQEWGKA
ncbi:acyl-coenzyme A synthetase ACSM3, mitochondrial-like isoform X2 [Dermochelys coriacea]|uniref:acyl-coenzyme A synthetase ACSM3, mitochondrial-like isoform X2 n=1 Tax=Dermochelys coriacea TaxID=27794 RepID=UPI001CA8D323|nr:acyl-coenzyme A synthetase ACSM3, mitochondrial-like isoform X2 [Dermochelys coriacea]